MTSVAPRLALSALTLLAAACSSPQAPPETSAAPSAEASAPPAALVAPTSAASSPSAAPASASAAPSVAPSSSASASAAAPAAPEPTPAVEVKNIGMHVGGGKNDAAEKAPIKRSVEPHLPAFAKCFAKTTDPKKGGDFGVDLRIEKDGGKAKVDHPRTSLKGDEFKACVLEVFTAIDFEKPKGGTTTVSYSLRFTPKKGD